MNEGFTTWGDEVRLSRGSGNFFINHRQVFSPDDSQIVYDTRAEDSGLAATGTIGVIDVDSGASGAVYHTSQQTMHGPGVGAAHFSPVGQRVIFLHGLRNANPQQPYGFTRRSAVAVDIDRPFEPVFLDGRDISLPFTPGAFRGGTHAHASTADGQWISFTYNDFVMEQAGRPDLRTVGVMFPGQATVFGADDLENYTGKLFAAVVAEVVDQPAWGSDEIDRAFDETWIGREGYLKPGGDRQRRAIAFQGNVRTATGAVITEVFIVDLPEDLTRSRPGKPLEGSADTRPNVPAGVVQRRVTYSKTGICGPRHWLFSTPDGQRIGYLSADRHGAIQLFTVSPNGGDPEQVTHHPFSIQSQVTVSNDGRDVVYLADNRIFVTSLIDQGTVAISHRYAEEDKPLGAIVFSNNGRMLAYNRMVNDGQGKHPAIFLRKRR